MKCSKWNKNTRYDWIHNPSQITHPPVKIPSLSINEMFEMKQKNDRTHPIIAHLHSINPLSPPCYPFFFPPLLENRMKTVCPRPHLLALAKGTNVYATAGAWTEIPLTQVSQIISPVKSYPLPSQIHVFLIFAHALNPPLYQYHS